MGCLGGCIGLAKGGGGGQAMDGVCWSVYPRPPPPADHPSGKAQAKCSLLCCDLEAPRVHSVVAACQGPLTPPPRGNGGKGGGGHPLLHSHLLLPLDEQSVAKSNCPPSRVPESLRLAKRSSVRGHGAGSWDHPHGPDPIPDCTSFSVGAMPASSCRA